MVMENWEGWRCCVQSTLMSRCRGLGIMVLARARDHHHHAGHHRLRHYRRYYRVRLDHRHPSYTPYLSPSFDAQPDSHNTPSHVGFSMRFHEDHESHDTNHNYFRIITCHPLGVLVFLKSVQFTCDCTMEVYGVLLRQAENLMTYTLGRLGITKQLCGIMREEVFRVVDGVFILLQL
jgi:hypothetical protein